MLCNNRPTATEIRNIAVHQGNVHRLVLPQAFKTVHFIFFVKIMCALQKKKLQQQLILIPFSTVAPTCKLGKQYVQNGEL